MCMYVCVCVLGCCVGVINDCVVYLCERVYGAVLYNNMRKLVRVVLCMKSVSVGVSS